MSVINSNGIINFINKSISNFSAKLNTSNMGTIIGISEDKTKLDIEVDTTKIKLFDTPFFTLQGGGNYLQFPIKVGDKCLLVFSKDTVEDWLSGNKDIIFNSDFDINNGFALVGINNDTNSIKIEDYTKLKVDKLKITNDTEDIVSLLSDTIGFLSQTSDLLSSTNVVISSGSSAGTYPLSTSSQFGSLKTQIDTLKTKFDQFKV